VIKNAQLSWGVNSGASDYVWLTKELNQAANAVTPGAYSLLIHDLHFPGKARLAFLAPVRRSTADLNHPDQPSTRPAA
jgi:hypothetical protein